MELSIVTTLYQSAPYLNEFYHRILKATEKITHSFEIIFVDDGSPDNSLSIAKKIVQADSRVRLIELSRNFGHHGAMLTGLTHASGDLIFLIDCDLEEDPELLINFYETMKNQSSDVVFGAQRKRKGGFLEKITGSIFYKAINYMSSTKIPKNILTIRLMKKNYVSALLQHKERVIFLHGLWMYTGFKQHILWVDKHHKKATTYNFSTKVKLAIDSITSFSEKPLQYVFNLGCSMSALSFGYIFYLLIRRFFLGIAISGWASLIVSIWFFGGLIIFCIGIIGLYLARIFIEVKQRPLSIIRAIHTTPAHAIQSDTSLEENFQDSVSH